MESASPRPSPIEAQQSLLLGEIGRLMTRKSLANDEMRRMAVFRGELLLHELRLFIMSNLSLGIDEQVIECLRDRQLELEKRIEHWASQVGSVAPLSMPTRALTLLLPEFDGQHEHEWFSFRKMFELVVRDIDHRAYWLRKALKGKDPNWLQFYTHYSYLYPKNLIPVYYYNITCRGITQNLY